MKKSVQSALLLIIVCLYSCQLNHKTYCGDPKVHLRVNGFDSSQLGQVIVRSYTKGSGFANLVRTVTCSSVTTPAPGSAILPMQKIDAMTFTADGIEFTADYDYKIEIANASPVHEVTGFAVSHGYIWDNTGSACTNAASWVIDGALNSVSQSINNNTLPVGVYVSIVK